MNHKMFHCGQCRGKKRFTYVGVATDGFREIQWWNDNKGHWINVDRITSKLVNHIMKVTYLEPMRQLFNSPSIMWQRLHG